MNKIALIIEREYLSRVRKKSFIIMTLLAPVLMGAIMALPVLIVSFQNNEVQKVAVADASNSFEGQLKNTDNVAFSFVGTSVLDSLKKNFARQGYFALLYIPNEPLSNKIELYSEKQPSMQLKSDIEDQLEKELEKRNFQAAGLTKAKLDSMQVKLRINTYTLQDGQAEESFSEMTMIIGFVGAIVIYMFVFIYGTQIMRGVMEEKTNRIVEVLISSVKPFELMMGKIIGVALVALTQFVIWIALTAVIFIGIQSFVSADMMKKSLDKNMVQNPQAEQIQEQLSQTSQAGKIMTAFANYNWTLLVVCFVFYFIGGYLLYGSLFAAIGAAVDNEADTQQFILPVTLPFVIGFIVAQTIVQNPESNIGVWFSVIPFTSPIVMMVRLAYGTYAAWELILSMVLLVATFIGTTWLAAKIYRTGILMYGKKTTYKELWKWLRY